MRLRNESLSLAIMVGILLTSATSAGAQVDVSAWPQVQMEILALDAQGIRLDGVTRDELVVKEGKKAHPIVDLKPASDPQSICLLIDASASMYTRLDVVLTKARRFARSLPPDDEICVADFSGKLFVDQPFMQDHPAVEKGLTMIKSSGGTAERDALVSLADLMRTNAKYKSRAIVLFSDGSDNSSKINWQQMKQKLEQQGSPVVHMVVVPQQFGNARYKQFDPEEKAAFQLTKPTGGLVYFPHNMSDLNSIVDHLAEILRSRYVLMFQAENAAKDGQEQGLQVLFDKAHQADNAVVLAPEAYYAPSP